MIKLMKKMIVWITMGLLTPTLIFSQGMLLNRGESGLAISGSLSLIGDVIIPGTAMQYSFNGIADIGVSYSEMAIEESPFKLMMLSSGGSLHFLKQSREIPVSMAVAGVFQFYALDRNNLLNSVQDLDYLGSVIAGYIYRRHISSKGVNVIPYMGYVVSKQGRAKLSYLSVGFSLIDNDPGQYRFFSEPSIVFINGYFVQYTIAFGVLLNG